MLRVPQRRWVTALCIHGLATHAGATRSRKGGLFGVEERLRLGEGQRRHGFTLPESTRVHIRIQERQGESSQQRSARPVRALSNQCLALPWSEFLLSHH